MNITRVLTCALNTVRISIPAYRKTCRKQAPHSCEAGRATTQFLLIAGIVAGFILTIFGPQVVAAWLANQP